MVGFFEELDIKELVVECVDHAVLIGEQQAKDKFVDSVVDGVKPVVITVEASKVGKNPEAQGNHGPAVAVPNINQVRKKPGAGRNHGPPVAAPNINQEQRDAKRQLDKAAFRVL